MENYFDQMRSPRSDRGVLRKDPEERCAAEARVPMPQGLKDWCAKQEEGVAGYLRRLAEGDRMQHQWLETEDRNFVRLSEIAMVSIEEDESNYAVVVTLSGGVRQVVKRKMDTGTAIAMKYKLITKLKPQGETYLQLEDLRP